MRTVVCEHSVTTVIDEAVPQYPRINEMWDALVWKISRRPDLGIGVAADFYTYRQKRRLKMYPDLVVLYTFDSDLVTIHRLRVIP